MDTSRGGKRITRRQGGSTKRGTNNTLFYAVTTFCFSFDSPPSFSYLSRACSVRVSKSKLCIQKAQCQSPEVLRLYFMQFLSDLDTFWVVINALCLFVVLLFTTIILLKHRKMNVLWKKSECLGLSSLGIVLLMTDRIITFFTKLFALNADAASDSPYVLLISQILLNTWGTSLTSWPLIIRTWRIIAIHSPTCSIHGPCSCTCRDESLLPKVRHQRRRAQYEVVTLCFRPVCFLSCAEPLILLDFFAHMPRCRLPMHWEHRHRSHLGCNRPTILSYGKVLPHSIQHADRSSFRDGGHLAFRHSQEDRIQGGPQRAALSLRLCTPE